MTRILKLFFLNTHISLIHEGKEPFKCMFCDNNFSSKGNLSAHISAIHEKKISFECNICCKKFTRKCTLKIHKSEKWQISVNIITEMKNVEIIDHGSKPW